jgi:hypothetical protein
MSTLFMRDLIAAGAVDEYRLFVYRSRAGPRRAVVPDATEVPKLRLVDAQPCTVLLRPRTA